MVKKLLIILSILFMSIILTFSNSFATNVANDVKEGSSSLVNDVRNGIGIAENTVEGAIKDVGNTVGITGTSMNNNSNDNLRNDNYTATRTSLTNTLSTGNMFWTWIILAIAGVIIVSLVWYYGSQRNNKID